MTFDQFQRACIVRFAYQQAKHTGSLDCMRAVCYVLRNRVRQGWSDTWVECIEKAGEYAGNAATPLPPIDITDRLFLHLLREIDDIFFSANANDLVKVVGESLYYIFIDKPENPWFVEHVLRDRKNHACEGVIGMMHLHL